MPPQNGVGLNYADQSDQAWPQSYQPDQIRHTQPSQYNPNLTASSSPTCHPSASVLPVACPCALAAIAIPNSIHSNAFESPFLSTATQRRVTEQTFEAHRTK